MADDASGSGSASMSISSSSQRSSNHGQDHELHATVTPTEVAHTEAHHETTEALDQLAPAGETGAQGLSGDFEKTHEGDHDEGRHESDQITSGRHESRPSDVPASSDNDDDAFAISTRAAAASQRLPPARRAEEMRPPRPLADQPHNTVRHASRKVTGSTGQPSIVAALGLADKNGRPTKGLAMGAKAGRRA